MARRPTAVPRHSLRHCRLHDVGGLAGGSQCSGVLLLVGEPVVCFAIQMRKTVRDLRGSQVLLSEHERGVRRERVSVARKRRSYLVNSRSCPVKRRACLAQPRRGRVERRSCHEVRRSCHEVRRSQSSERFLEMIVVRTRADAKRALNIRPFVSCEGAFVYDLALLRSRVSQMTAESLIDLLDGANLFRSVLGWQMR
jgi:hypothetical protein